MLEALIRKRLVKVDGGGGLRRFRQLETLRAFASERLIDDPEGSTIRGRFVDWYVDYAVNIEPDHRGSRQAAALAETDRELDNLRSAVEAAQSIDRINDALQLVGYLWRYWRVRGLFDECRDLVDRLRRTSTEASLGLCRALCAAGNIAVWQQDFPHAYEYLDQAVLVADQVGDLRWGKPFGLLIGGIARVEAGDASADARTRLRESLDLWQQLSDSTASFLAHFWLGAWHRHHDEFDHAREFEALCMADLAEHDDIWSQAQYMYRLAGLREDDALREIPIDDGQLAVADELLEASVEIWRILGDTLGLARTLTSLVRIRVRLRSAGLTTVRQMLEAMSLLPVDRQITPELRDAMDATARLLDYQDRFEDAMLFAYASLLMRPNDQTRYPRAKYEQQLEADLRCYHVLPQGGFASRTRGRTLASDPALALKTAREVLTALIDSEVEVR